MPLNADNVLRVGRGSAATSSTATAITVTLDSAATTTAGSVVVVALFGEGLTFATPSGWAVIGTPANGLSVYRRGPVEGLAAGESSWNFTPSATAGKAVTACAVELAGLDTASTVDVVGAVNANTSGTSALTLSLVNGVYDGLALAFHGARSSVSATVDTQTPAYALALEQGQAGTGNSVDLAVSYKTVQSIGVQSASNTISRTLTSASPSASMLVVVAAEGSRRATDLHFVDGAEHGTATGNTLGTTGYRLIQVLGAAPTVSASAARSGSYGWLLSTTAVQMLFHGEAFLFSAVGFAPCYRRCFRFPTLPGADTVFWAWSGTSWPGVTVTFRAATGQIGVQVGTGTEVLSDAAITANQWFGIDLQIDLTGRAAGNCVANWQIDYNAELADTTGPVTQTQATRTGSGITALNITERIGWPAAATATMHTDDGAVAVGLNYPIGDVRVVPLKVDPAGTPTTSGATTDFGVMTNNGTVAAWNAANARNAVDDIPPDLSGTRDAAVCLVANASTYAEFPMETYDLAANRCSVRGAKFVAPVWAASSTATTIRVAVYDGTTEHSVFPEGAPTGFGNTATPAWIARTVRAASGRLDWTQAKVNALTVRMGSNDANPDIGLDMLLIELATVKAQTETLFGESGAPIYVEASRDPATTALVGATVSNASGEPIKLAYEIDGVPSETASIPSGTSGLYVPLSADGGIETVGRVSIIPG